MKIARAQLEALDTVIKGLNAKKYSTIRGHLVALQEKLTKASAPKPAAGIGVHRAIEAMRGVLGKALAVPKAPSTEWLMWMASRIRNLGLTEQDCAKIARVMSRKWEPPYGFEYAIKAADRLLAESETTLTKKGVRRTEAPVEMGE
jgi:hypothetical protein